MSVENILETPRKTTAATSCMSSISRAYLEDGVEAEVVRLVAHGLAEVVFDVENGLALRQEGILVNLNSCFDLIWDVVVSFNDGA